MKGSMQYEQAYLHPCGCTECREHSVDQPRRIRWFARNQCEVLKGMKYEQAYLHPCGCTECREHSARVSCTPVSGAPVPRPEKQRLTM